MAVKKFNSMNMIQSSLSFCFLLLSMTEVCIASLNVNGARNSKKRTELFEVIKQKKIDVAFIQETHSDVKNAADWMQEWDGFSVLSHNTTLSGGVAILFSKSFCPVSYQVDEIVKGKLLKIRAIFEK